MAIKNISLLFGLIFLASCSESTELEEETGEDTEVAAPETICEQVSDGAIENILGEVPTPESDSVFGVKSCEWSLDKEGETFSTAVSVLVNNVSTYDSVLDAMRPSGELVDGLGSEAFVAEGYSTATGGSTRGSTLYVADDESLFIISAVVDDERTSTEQLVAIAEELLEK